MVERRVTNTQCKKRVWFTNLEHRFVLGRVNEAKVEAVSKKLFKSDRYRS